MITREFNLYLHAGHSIPLVINVNQYDRGEQWLFTLFNSDGTKYVPSSGAIVGIKSDKLGIINSGTVDSQGRVVINETQQMTAAVGKAVFELLIDDQTHGTANFVVLVEPKPGDNADLSESDLSLIQQAIDGTSETAIAQGVSDWMDENLTPTTPVVDTSLTVSGAAADSAKVGQEISDLKSQITLLSSIPREVKLAMDAMFANMAVKDDSVYKDEYALFHVSASSINVIAISGLFEQGANVIYYTDSLDVLKQYLTVTASYDDGTTAVITTYELSGTLTPGTSVITATYEDKSASFSVNVSNLGKLTQSANGIASTASHLYTDEGVTKQTSLKSSGAIYYYLDEVVSEDTTYDVSITISTGINTHQYKAVYAYRSELLSGAGTGDPTIYNITNLQSGGILDATQTPISEPFVYTTQVTVKTGRQLAIEFYRDQHTVITSITAQKGS